jgi:FkbM family methyltransferase
MGLFRRRSLKGFLQARTLRKRLEQPPVVIRQRVSETEIAFSVHTWVEYHNRALQSYTGEPDMVMWLRNNLRADDVLWDVGANVGAYSLLAAKLVPATSVIAFEPFIPSFSHLWQNILLNGLEMQIVPLCLALSDKSGVDFLGVNDPRAGSAEHVLGGKDFMTYQSVSAITGDAAIAGLGIKAPTLLKIDVDGYEVNVLKGMASMLEKITLRTCIVEVEREKTEAKVDSLMRSAKFNRESDSSTLSQGPVFNVVYVRPSTDKPRRTRAANKR